MATLADTLIRALDNYGRIWLMVTEAIADPTSQSNIDTIVAAAEGAGVVRPKVTYTVSGPGGSRTVDWTAYQAQLGKIMTDLKTQIIRAQGPFETRSRSRF